MNQRSREFTRMRQLLAGGLEKPQLAELKRQVRKWSTFGGPGQDAINRAIVRALDEIQQRIDRLMQV